MPTPDCPPARSAWAPDEPAVAHRSDQPRSAVSSAESRFYQQTISSAPLFIADAFVPALLLYHPPRGLRHGGLAGHCNNSARKVSRAGACDMLSAAEALVRNATLPSTPHRFGRCAVVGSSSQLVGRRLGACIDGHDAVIRTNDAPTSLRYADDVGQRTTWRLSTMQSWRDAVSGTSALRADAQLLYCMEPWVGECQHHGLSGRIGGQHASMINPLFVGQVQHATFALAQKVRQDAHDWHYSEYFGYAPTPPTTGMLAVFAALRACDQVNAFGLTLSHARRDGSLARGGCAKYYVGREGGPRRSGKCMSATSYFGSEGASTNFHDWSMQMRALQRMEASGLATLVE